VTDVDATAQRLVELGSERLSPTLRASDGAPFAILRDPGGAVVAVRASTARPRRAPVAWHQLHTRDRDRVWTAYSELFGWVQTETLEVPDPVGDCQMFAWEAGGKSVGGMANTARTVGVHAHWLFFFPVPDLEAAMARARAHGGRAPAEAITLPNGDRLAPCEDGQGAAFGLHQSAPRG
jgi:predicted enzyme related to lactoylglutathione lyase